MKRRGFTLVELLVVLAIVLLASLVAIPAIYSSLNGRQVTDAARIFTGALVGIRDSAIRYNEPRGLRLLPDPVLTIPAPGLPSSGSLQLVYNRMIPIEPAGDYSQGSVTIGPQFQPGTTQTNFPPIYAYPSMPSAPVDRYPFPNSSGIPHVLMIEESPYVGGFLSPAGQPNAPTNWYWNIRVGDKIKISGTGRAYTIVGPCVVNPWASAASGNQGNPELFVNVGAPGVQTPLSRNYYLPDATAVPPVTDLATARPEFLFLVNGEDDDNDGYVDEGFDGVNNNPIPKDTSTALATDNSSIDEPFEWEVESWKGALSEVQLKDTPATVTTNTPSTAWAVANFQNGAQDLPYIIERRPVPSQNAREISLPTGMVIDATTWNTTRERSRIPIQPGSLYCDIMVTPKGQYIPTTLYSTPTSADPVPFLHFWLTERGDVHPRGSVWGLDTDGIPKPNPNNTTDRVFFELPLAPSALGGTREAPVVPTADGQYYPGAATGVPVLKGDRRLVTMFNQSGLITTNTIETILPPTGFLMPGEGFHTADINYPFLKAQQGSREAR